MMTPEEKIQYLEGTRQSDLNAMLVALLLIERGQIDQAKQALLERLPINITNLLLKTKGSQ